MSQAGYGGHDAAIRRLPAASGATTVGVTIDVPPTLRKARTAAGENLWLDALPELVGQMASRWSLTMGRTRDGFGMNALVVEATGADGVAAVLKLAPPGEAERLELEQVWEEGVVAEPEYDLGVLMRNAPGEDDLHERANWLAAATGFDRTAIWEWGTAERVLSGLWCRVVDHQPHGDKQLADAERLCR